MEKIDLHLHTTASDGTDTPAELVAKAAAAGLRAIAVTDHDTAAGVAPAMAAGQALGVEVISGIELSSDYRDNNIHLLGYFIDPAAPALREVLDWARIERDKRNEKIVERLAAAGYDISLAQLQQEYPGAVLGRPHFCEHLVKKGVLSSVQEGFETLLGVGCPFYLPKERLPFARAAEVVRAAGGIPVLAHPLQYGYRGAELMALVEEAQRCGVRHLEAYYSEHSPAQQQEMLALAASLSFGVSGGSDYHGTRKPHIRLGELAVPYEVLSALRAAQAAQAAAPHA